ncbi:hypothetical protein EA462_05260 [Natrarchaeobius halalkaliphilus]|uniref:YbjN domain-containing protein n=1 Tax=Natrarchaeobius halalkaliphilus TaxID=1679091 RepID=A0A3N6N0F8_9EURY|nr:DUF5813 family protein [Natrarchaeobius halalkaliphilus]RQG91382.1 hypothetical protein EA462_05260 [Natrarchaeobius halalkaliphilus]
MTTVPPAIEQELESHDAFDQSDEDYTLTTTVFDTTVTAVDTNSGRGSRFLITVTLPTLDAAVANETVAPVVEDGWFETLERRLEDAFTVSHTDTHEKPTVDRDATDVRVTLEYVAGNARDGVEDAKALIEYVEGTFAQGIIPGYDYRGEAETLLGNAQSRGDRPLHNESRE